MGVENQADQAQILLRTRLCNPNFIFTILSDSPDSNYSKLKYIMSSSVTEACNNSALLLGPRGCGKVAILEMVIKDLLQEYPDMICVIKLNGLLHSEDNCALKEIARQLCIENQLVFSKMASFDDNSQFVIAMLRECGLAHKTIVFVLDEFDLFTQGKQRLLYSLLDAMQSVTSQAVVIGVSCRLDADQLLEKRVRSRFSHRKLLFLPPSEEDLQKILQHALLLPTESGLPPQYVDAYNKKLLNTLSDDKFRDIIKSLCDSDSTFNHLLRFLFAAVCQMDTKSGFLSLDNFKTALSSIQRQPKLEALQGTTFSSVMTSFLWIFFVFRAKAGRTHLPAQSRFIWPLSSQSCASSTHHHGSSSPSPFSTLNFFSSTLGLLGYSRILFHSYSLK